jgi:ribosomal-protein-alanine N-acetyltransferase
VSGNDDYKLQPARLADAARLATMSHEFVEAGLRPAWDAARIGWHVRHEDSVVLTACSAGMLAGFAIMRYGEERAHLNLLAVVPWHRRRGVARRLVGWLEETALTAGTFRITLELRERNLEGRAFYASLGYRELRQIPGYYQGVEAALRMERDVRDGRTTLPGTPQQRS